MLRAQMLRAQMLGAQMLRAQVLCPVHTAHMPRIRLAQPHPTRSPGLLSTP